MAEISVIVPIYGCEKYVGQCIESILNQSFSSLEIILVDDGSKDNSGKICDDYAIKDNRITVIHKTNGGLSSARNAGLEIASGKYVMFCDADDLVDKYWCEEMYNLIHNSTACIGVCGFRNMDEKGCSFFSDTVYVDDCGTENTIINLLNHQLLNYVWNKIYINDSIKKGHLQFRTGLKYSEDFIFVLEYMISSGESIAVSDRPLYLYRRDVNNSLSRQYVEGFWEIKEETLQQLEAVLKKCHVEDKLVKDTITKAWRWPIINAVSYVFHKDNTSTVFKKYKMLHKIMNSEQCKNAYIGWDLCELSGIYKTVMRTRNPLIILMFHMTYNMIYKIRSRRNEN